jgi:hypothetical protein
MSIFQKLYSLASIGHKDDDPKAREWALKKDHHLSHSKKPLSFFKDVPVGHEFTANQWGYYPGRKHRFIKYTETSARHKKYPDLWGPTRFNRRDVVIHHGPTHKD